MDPTAPPATVYALVAEAVYDHGVIGVYTTEAKARDAAAELWPTTDGHHGFRIVPRALDSTYPDTFQKVYSSGSRTTDEPLTIALEDPAATARYFATARCFADPTEA
jgi:hypothetical protein